MKSKTVVAWTVVAVAAAGAYFVQKTYGTPAMQMDMAVRGGADAKVPVTVAKAEEGPLAAAVTYTGTVAAYAEEDVYPRVTGRIVEMRVYPGDRVEPGQVVAKLDDVELGSKVREAAAALAAAEANLAQMEADIAAARQGVAQAEAEAGYQQSVAARDERLFGRGAISQQEAENSRAMAAAARAKLEQAKAMEASALKKREAMKAMAAQSQAVLRTNEVVRDYVNIRAASNGFIAKRLIAPGTLVQPGMAILKIAQIDRVRFQANVAERDVARLRVGSPVRVRPAGGDGALDLKATSIFPFAEGPSRTAVVEAMAPNPGRRFLPGQYVTMEFELGDRANVVSVPRGAVQRVGDQAFVWTVGSDTAVRRDVKTGATNADRVAILDGLKAGETVVVSGAENLFPGAKVEAAGLEVAAAPGTPEMKAMPEMKGMGEMKSMPPAKAPAASGDATIDLITKPKPPVVGKNTFVITVRDKAGKPIPDATVKITYGMPPMQGMPAGMTMDDEAKPKGNGEYELPVQLGMASSWNVTVVVAKSGQNLGTATFNLQVK